MLVLAFIGDNLERALGSVRYAWLYLICAVGSSAISIAWNIYSGTRQLSAGASGAIFGVVGALVVILIRNHGRLETSPKTTPRYSVMVRPSMVGVVVRIIVVSICLR